MAGSVTKYALEVYRLLSKEQQQQICHKLGEKELEAILKNFVENLYIPQSSENGIIPQDDTFLQKIIIDVEKYRVNNTKQTILKDYSRSQVNDMQVLKQADVVMLMYVLGLQFSSEIKKENLKYYEPKTIHDSSLSRAIHSLVACNCDEIECAFEQFLYAIDIDIGENPFSSDLGIHAASMGGIWLNIVEGFAGVYESNEKLYVNPKLPKAIKSISFRYHCRGVQLDISIADHEVIVDCKDEQEKTIYIAGKEYMFINNLIATY